MTIIGFETDAHEKSIVSGEGIRIFCSPQLRGNLAGVALIDPSPYLELTDLRVGNCSLFETCGEVSARFFSADIVNGEIEVPSWLRISLFEPQSYQPGITLSAFFTMKSGPDGQTIRSPLIGGFIVDCTSRETEALHRHLREVRHAQVVEDMAHCETQARLEMEIVRLKERLSRYE